MNGYTFEFKSNDTQNKNQNIIVIENLMYIIFNFIFLFINVLSRENQNFLCKSNPLKDRDTRLQVFVNMVLVC